MKICIVYDCLFPWTVGGAERWYRRLAEAYTDEGHEVVYLTMRQWTRGDAPQLPRVKIIPVAPRMTLYVEGRRRILPPLVFGVGVFAHLLRHGRSYDLVHTASFPFFSLLAAGVLRRFSTYSIAVDWHEVWTRSYWQAYLGKLGRIGWLVQRTCARFRQTAFSFSRLHATRAAELSGQSVTLLEGEYDGLGRVFAETASEPAQIVFAGRMIPEKRVDLLVESLALAMSEDPKLCASLIGQGPQFGVVKKRVEALGLSGRITLPGFVEEAELERMMRGATAIVQPSAREGYGMIVVEAAARGVPSIVIAGEDNAATELVEPGRNGFIAEAASPPALAQAILTAVRAGPDLRAKTSEWYSANAIRLSFDNSFRTILETIDKR
jgi:glycosyltransferase involved in cell wall biosynthesis